MKLLFQIIFFFGTLHTCKAYGQVKYHDRPDWIILFGDTAKPGIDTAEKISADAANYYIVKTPPGSASHLFSQPAVSVERQLNEQCYIIRTSATWISKHVKQLEYASASNCNWKLSPALLGNSALLNSLQKSVFHIKVTNIEAFASFRQQHLPEMIVRKIFPELGMLRIECTYHFAISQLLRSDKILYIEHADRHANEESVINRFDNSLNSINLVHTAYPDINGKGLTASIKENRFDTTDIDLLGRTISTTVSSNTVSAHATYIATVAAGAGNSFYLSKGGAWKTSLTSADFKILLPDIDAYKQYKISVQNHSYGVGIENFYGGDASAYDTSSIMYPYLLHIFSAGNAGDQAPDDGVYKGVQGFANLTGSFKMAKNILTVGSINSLGLVSFMSSKGPAYDGRVKPELVAFGESGSSEASAVTTGVALLVQDAYLQNHPGKLPDNSLVKALLINSANSLESRISFSSGYGSVNAHRSVRNVVSENFFSGAVTRQQDTIFTLQLPDSTKNLKLTLVWNDPSASPNAFKSLVNDLDIKLIRQATNEEWLPWILNSSPNKDSLQQLPHTGRDSLNVVEQITVDNPASGNYVVRVSGVKVVGAPQPFYIAYQWDTLNHFSWTSPTRNDNFIKGAGNFFRWENSYARGTSGKLEYSDDNGNHWKTIDPSVNLYKNYYQWNAADTSAAIIARMMINGRPHVSDTFTLSSPSDLHIGFDCPDSVMLYWNKTAGAKNYVVYSLDGKYKTAVKYNTDTSAVLAKRNTGYPYFGVAPVFSNGYSGVEVTVHKGS